MDSHGGAAAPLVCSCFDDHHHHHHHHDVILMMKKSGGGLVQRACNLCHERQALKRAKKCSLSSINLWQTR
uniref:Uncharacterized protein n=1 Tax=Physcomitrium patens TaxID=3218 RepID=A0A2K1J6S8_PHYPA|nr:hypothetical protein PHYPA_020333 [Physcomitrium patens]